MLRYGTVRTRRGTRVAFATVGGDRGSAVPVLLVHPINLRKECWLDVVHRLAPDRLCVAVDLADHGESSDGAECSLGGWVADCRDVIASLDLERFHLVGGSLGGTIALCLASELPQQALSVAAMGSSLGADPRDATAEPDPIRMLDEGSVEDLFAVLAAEAVAPASAPWLVATVRHLTNSHGRDVVRRTLRAAAAADATPWLAGVRCPVLVVTGAYDKACPPEAGQRMAIAVGGWHEVLPKVGHLPMIEDAAAVARVLRPHLDSAEMKAVVR